MYKKITEEYEDRLFDNYYLTELMLLKKNGRKIKSNDSVALDILLRQKLTEYGLSLFGQFDQNGLTFRSLRIFDEFPIENEPIIKQCYGYSNIKPHIQLRGFDSYCAAFDYNLDSGECELQRHCYGTVTDRINYGSLSEMLEDIKLKGYDNIFDEVVESV